MNQMAEARFYLGIDAGGTKTHAVIADQEGRILGAGVAGTGNWEAIGLDGAAHVYADVLAQALASAGLRAGDLRAAGYGLAGMDWPSDEARLAPVLDRLAVLGPRIAVNDAYVALRAGSDEGYGVAVISGTGVVVVGNNRRGEHFRTFAIGGDWGDFGAASDIVDRATRAVGYAYLGRGPATLLAERFVAHYGAHSVPDLVEQLSRGATRWQGGRLAPLVFATATEGDQVARDVLAATGRDLGENVVAVARRLDLLGEPFDLVLAGGVLRARAPFFRDAIVATVRDSAPHARPTTLETSPVVGGVLLAMDAAGEPTGAAVRHRLIEEARRHPALADPAI
jgi:N-acetylglucosamine kinase-like BadF-type ATPase